MWVMGPGLKGAGAAAFLLDYLLRGSPRSFLLFAASDGALALLTLVALLRTPARIRRRLWVAGWWGRGHSDHRSGIVPAL